MQARLPKSFGTSRFKSQDLRRAFALFVALFSMVAVNSAIAHATLTIQSVSPYTLASGNLIPFAISTATVDTGDGFHGFDLTTTSNESDLVYLDVKSTKNFGTLTSTQDVVITVTVGGAAIPIAKAGPVGSIQDCSSSNCQGLSGGLYTAAKYSLSPAAQTYRIGFYPKQICATVTPSSGGCSSGNVVTPSAGSPTLFSVKIYIGLESSDGSIGTLSDSEENASVSLSFQSTGPTFSSCPSNLDGAYTPGDTEISLNPSVFSTSVSSGAAAVDKLIVLAKESTAGAFGAIDASGQITARVSSSSPSVISGFTNTTNGSDYTYAIAVYARDQAGALSPLISPCAGASFADSNYWVQTSSIQGLLTKSQCFIATAAFASAKDPVVMMLREFRDQVLLSSPLGEWFVRVYYRFSPAVAQLVIDHPALRVPVLVILGPIQIWAWIALHWSSMILAGVLLALVIFSKRIRSRGLVVLLIGTLLPLTRPALAEEEGSIIEQIRGETPSASESSSIEPYIEKKRKELGASQEDGSLIQDIRGNAPAVENADESYSQKIKKELSGSQVSGGVIQSVKSGESRIQARKAEREGNAFGFTISVRQNRAVTADSGAVYRNYDSMYGDGYTPDFQFFYESQPLHGEWVGSLGVFGQFGFSWKRAPGTFQFAPARPGGGSLSSSSSTDFTFITIPVTVGGVYRLNLLRFVRPYIKAGATVVGYVEDRSDNRGMHWGNSRGVLSGGGLAFPLDFLDSLGSWSMYEAYGVRRHCLTVDYQRIDTFSGALDFAVSGVSLGLLFEL